jgi:hypothetical protein
LDNGFIQETSGLADDAPIIAFAHPRAYLRTGMETSSRLYSLGAFTLMG